MIHHTNREVEKIRRPPSLDQDCDRKGKGERFPISREARQEDLLQEPFRVQRSKVRGLAPEPEDPLAWPRIEPAPRRRRGTFQTRTGATVGRSNDT